MPLPPSTIVITSTMDSKTRSGRVCSCAVQNSSLSERVPSSTRHGETGPLSGCTRRLILLALFDCSKALLRGHYMGIAQVAHHTLLHGPSTRATTRQRPCSSLGATDAAASNVQYTVCGDVASAHKHMGLHHSISQLLYEQLLDLEQRSTWQG